MSRKPKNLSCPRQDYRHIKLNIGVTYDQYPLRIVILPSTALRLGLVRGGLTLPSPLPADCGPLESSPRVFCRSWRPLPPPYPETFGRHGHTKQPAHVVDLIVVSIFGRFVPAQPRDEMWTGSRQFSEFAPEKSILCSYAQAFLQFPSCARLELDVFSFVWPLITYMQRLDKSHAPSHFIDARLLTEHDHSMYNPNGTRGHNTCNSAG